ncbi:ankyrin repeat protein [Mytilinidion resinicola]|uniref:Ankyrin repeat protein n=1 Tax=Mytilinidion resinicola TaxID=574789 RepID=A0A6A6ZAB2_9PEZI|nr:ankyrin repeat protein [Mytilinidion resinicola]KAF2817234.1 ankyrin repeat protein [Mytilinidion resinicola]
MASSTTTTLPEVPAKHDGFIPFVASHPDKSIVELLEPYKQYDAKLREIYAQEPQHPALANPFVNVVPLFNGHEADLKVRARDLSSESAEEKDRYIMSLDDEDRKQSGAPAVVPDLKTFQQNLTVFSESSLVDLDWNNVVAAGSSVVTSLLPVPEKYKSSKRALRQYYHEIVAPASDVDLFLYGLSEEEAVKKIIQIETKIRDAILTETTTVRTKNAITIASQYPTRHVQIVLRIYKSVSEILTGFDVDCSCAAYDGKQYSHRGFEVYWPLLDRSRIDPTIFERSFARTVGLARLLVLEKLPTSSERDSYMDQRRKERGRPTLNTHNRYSHRTWGNLKDDHEDEIAEWVEQDDVSDYHTFTVPYGVKFHAKKIEKLLYTKDLLLNAEWNKPKDREVNLHRHPAFFGFAEDVIHDCCGFCPTPFTPEEHDAAETESKIYVSGEISFIKDDAGRQAIGSFNPITDDDWTDMAYVGNTAQLCQAIVDGDLEHVQDWLSQEGSDPNCRDYTGRTPLHLAVQSSTPEIVQALIDRGARLVARLADGRTALHLAAARGNVEMVSMIMQRSEANEEDEIKKEDLRKEVRIAARNVVKPDDKSEADEEHEQDKESDGELIDDEQSNDDFRSTTTSSFVQVKDKTSEKEVDDDADEEPDFYDVNVLAWDTGCSPLHLAIVNGHVDVVKELVQSYGADVLLPIKLLNDYDKSPRAAILTLALSLQLPLEKAKKMTETLLELGASSAQADINQTTALHYFAGVNPELLPVLFEHDEPAAKRSINHLSVTGSAWSPFSQSPLMTAIESRNTIGVMKLLNAGAKTTIEFSDWMKSITVKYDEFASRDSKQNQSAFVRDLEQPIILAVQNKLPSVAIELLSRGADPNTLTKDTKQCITDEWMRSYRKMESLLDLVQEKLKTLREFTALTELKQPDPRVVDGEDYLKELREGTYKHFAGNIALNRAKKTDEVAQKQYERNLEDAKNKKGITEKKRAVEGLILEFEKLEALLVQKESKTLKELHPDLDLSKSNRGTNWNTRSQDPKPNPFKLEFGFNKVHDLDDEKRDAYLELFQAVWAGDIDSIKKFTLAPWGDDSDRTPLKIAVTDDEGFSPFSIAILRHHFPVAKALLEIAKAQYKPTEAKGTEIYNLAESDDEYSEEEEDDSDNDIRIDKQIIDKPFTIENIGEISTQVKSTTQPAEILSWSCDVWKYFEVLPDGRVYFYGSSTRKADLHKVDSLLKFAIFSNDDELFKFLLALSTEYKSASVEEMPRVPTFSNSDFEYAIGLGRFDLLGQMIKHAGAGLALDALVKKSGVKIEERPRYYQGLSVHGTKRSDWAAAGRRSQMRTTVSESWPPALSAAANGNIESVEWFLGDTPTRLYLEFAETNKADKRLRQLAQANGGFDKVLSTWLGARRDLIIHMAVLSKPSSDSVRLLEYLIKAVPDSLHTKSTKGYTPLALAFALRRVAAARTLIAAGADQTTRDHSGNNILHILFNGINSQALFHGINSPAKTKKDGLQKMLELIDPRLVSSLLTERSQDGPGAATPLALWLHSSNQSGYYYFGHHRSGTENQNNETEEKVATLRTILDFSSKTGYEHLELLDGAGDTPVHMATKLQLHDSLKLMLERRPDLLYRENATGRTPAEMAEDAYIAERVKDVPQFHKNNTSITDRSQESFVEGAEDDAKKATEREKIWTLCRTILADKPARRRLVSLFEANEVAKRLASRKKKSARDATGRPVVDANGQGQEVEETTEDEVSKFYSTAAGWDEDDAMDDEQ